MEFLNYGIPGIMKLIELWNYGIPKLWNSWNYEIDRTMEFMEFHNSIDLSIP